MDQDIPSFDTLLEIAQQDPDQLERIRKHLATSTINSAPRYLQPRLRGLQFQIDSARHLAKTPLSACIQLSEMMQQSFDELRDALNSPPIPVSAVDPRQSATVIPFPRRH